MTVALNPLDTDEKGLSLIDTIEGKQKLAIISESGLYSLVLRSDKPEAKPFRKWVTSEVLPSIRKTGNYSIPGATRDLTKTQKKLAIAQIAAEMLRMSDTSKIRMLTVIAKEDEILPTFLPTYVNEPEVKSLTALLNDHGVKLSAMKVNEILVDMGILEIKEREGTDKKDGKNKKVMKQFNSLTDAGLLYGRNETSPQNPRETQPLYFVDKFPRLLDRLNKVSACGY